MSTRALIARINRHGSGRDVYLGRDVCPRPPARSRHLPRPPTPRSAIPTENPNCPKTLSQLVLHRFLTVGHFPIEIASHVAFDTPIADSDQASDPRPRRTLHCMTVAASPIPEGRKTNHLSNCVNAHRSFLPLSPVDEIFP